MHSYSFLFYICLSFLITSTFISSLQVTISNDEYRYDTQGNFIDCHSGNILSINGTFYMYGERYDNVSGIGASPPIMRPHLVVYTSLDLLTWTYRGEIFSTWPNYPYGTFFTPWAVYNHQTNQVVIWFNAYIHGCCDGNWGVGISDNGLNFNVLSMNISGKYGQVDCNSILIDDDGTGYLLYSSIAENHVHSIEVLSPNYTTTIGVNLGLIGYSYSEGGVLFKYNNIYYIGYGSCCCFCKNGSGWVVHSATDIKGPWTRQPYDLNCEGNNPICGGYGERSGYPLIVNAQGIGLSYIPLANGDTAILWHGDRFLTAPYANPSCPDECQPQVPPLCGDDPRYIKGHMHDYWYPLQFNSDHTIQSFNSFVHNFTLDISQNFGTDHLPGGKRNNKKQN